MSHVSTRMGYRLKIHGAVDIFWLGPAGRRKSRHSLFEASDSNGTVLLVLKVQLVIDLRRQFILGCIRTQYLIV